MVTGKRRRTTLVSILAFLSGLEPPEPTPPSPNACPMCRHEGKFPTGECSFCGVYKCKECQKYHLGCATQPCNGFGVDLPAPE